MDRLERFWIARWKKPESIATRVYVTNVVKHFKWEPRGKRRIHKKPNSREIAACRPWMEAELRLVRPKVLVCLGATAAQAIFGPSFRVTRDRGKVLDSEFAPKVVATVHPSSLLRQPDEESREREYKLFVKDLRVALRAAGRKIKPAAALATAGFKIVAVLSDQGVADGEGEAVSSFFDFFFSVLAPSFTDLASSEPSAFFQ